MALGYLLAALVMFILIITIPFALWPFGRTLVKRPDAGAPSVIGNVLWLLLAGWWLALGHLVTGVLLCLTIIGIPLGLGNFKLIPVSLWPFGRQIVPIDYAEAGEAVSIRAERRSLPPAAPESSIGDGGPQFSVGRWAIERTTSRAARARSWPPRMLE